MRLLQAVIDAWDCLAGVDGSERIADVAKRLVSANKLAADQGGAISIVQGRLEQLDKLPADKVGDLDSSLCIPRFVHPLLLCDWGQSRLLHSMSEKSGSVMNCCSQTGSPPNFFFFFFFFFLLL